MGGHKSIKLSKLRLFVGLMIFASILCALYSHLASDYIDNFFWSSIQHVRQYDLHKTHNIREDMSQRIRNISKNEPRKYEKKNNQFGRMTEEKMYGTIKGRNMSDVGSCLSSDKIVYVKTHKTASTTLASIMERYGYLRNRTFAVGLSHILSFTEPFNRNDVLSFPKLPKPQTFDMLTNHARFNFREMNFVVPNATFITIIRHPLKQLESAFSYFKMYQSLGLEKYENSFEIFMKDPMRYFKRKDFFNWQFSRNAMLFDFGLNHEYHNNMTRVQGKIEEIDQHFSLVLLGDYFDESLVLLMKEMCWNFEDILYIWKLGKRKYFEISPEMTKKIMKWNEADVKLYDHFNKTFWEKVNKYGSEFWKDIKMFERLQQKLRRLCNSKSFKTVLESNDEPLFNNWTEEKCKMMRRRDIPWTNIIRQDMGDKFGRPSYLIPVLKEIKNFLLTKPYYLLTSIMYRLGIN